MYYKNTLDHIDSKWYTGKKNTLLVGRDNRTEVPTRDHETWLRPGEGGRQAGLPSLY